MGYPTREDLQADLGAHYAKLTDRDDGTTANDAVGQEILDQAISEFHGWISGRYQTPVDCSADAARAASVRSRVLAIAVKIAWEKSRWKMEMPPIIRAGYDDAIKYLMAVAAGKAVLPGTTAVTPPTSEGEAAKVVGNSPIYGDEAIEGLL